VLLLDEPTAHLDPPHQWALARLFRELAATHTVVTVLHDLSLALQADTVAVLGQGRLHIHAAHHDPALHRQLECQFSPAVRIEPLAASPGRFAAAPMPLDAPGAGLV
jgi:iron complex transport system ATP-binding protein